MRPSAPIPGALFTDCNHCSGVGCTACREVCAICAQQGRKTLVNAGRALLRRPRPRHLPAAAVSAPVTRLDDRRPPCRCEPWAQRWNRDRPERCARCGGMFPARTVDARRPRAGDPI